MKLGTRGRYAVMAMVDLAYHANNHPISISDIAYRQGLPVPYLEQLFALLRRQDFIKSIRGQHGGYVLSRPASDINVAEVIHAVGETFKATRCSKGALGACLPSQAQCLTHDLWRTVEDSLAKYFSVISLEDVCQQRFPPPFLPEACQDAT